MRRFPYTVLAIVLIIVIVAIAFTAGAMKAGLDANSTPAVMAVLAMVSGAIPALLALVKVEQTNHKVDETHKTVTQVQEDLGNGVMEAHVMNAVQKAMGEETDAVRGEKG